jgi:tetratricopeptide (TPR) repeat protein
MKIKAGLLVAALVTGSMVFAQSVNDGKKFLYYERYKSAKETFEKIVNANPNNVEAVYWLGQTFLDQPYPDVPAARAVYAKALQANGNAPLLLTGMGEVELFENKTADARQRFETAISLTKGKDAVILNAVGKANVEAKAGDKYYGIDKINQAIEKDKKNTEYYFTLGDAYRKLIEGGKSESAYSGVFNIEPNNARALYKIAKIYITQRNTDVFIPMLNKATEADPAFAPAYLALYDHYSLREVSKAEQYLQKYLANADKDCSNEFFYANYLLRAGKYNESLTRGKELEASACGTELKARLKLLYGYNYDRLGDSVQAKANLDEYFKLESPDKFSGPDYDIAAKVAAKFPGNEAQAAMYYQKAIEVDTVMEKKLEYTRKIIALYSKSGNAVEEANWTGKYYAMRTNPTKRDLYDWGYANYAAKNYKTTDSIFAIYTQKYPDEIYGHLMRARANKIMDSTMALGLAVPHYQKLIDICIADPVANKKNLVAAYWYLGVYYADAKNDRTTAIDYLNKGLVVDPGNAEFTAAIQALQKAGNKPPPPAPAPKPGKPAPAKPATGGTKPAAGKPTGTVKPPVVKPPAVKKPAPVKGATVKKS